MKVCVDHHVRLSTPDKDGVTLRQHLEQLQKQTGITEPDLIPPEIPDGGQHLWIWFWELDAGRGSNGFGYEPLSYQDILAWCVLTETSLSPTEVGILKLMDAERLRKR